MIAYLDWLDKQLFALLNGWHSPFWDDVMWWLSDKEIWIPVYVLLFVWMIRRDGWKLAVWALVCVGLLILCADQTASHLLKPWIERPRPCHDVSLDFVVHLVNGKCGGKYGFVSSHAANFVGLAVFLGLWSKRKRYFWLGLLIAVFVAYSRVYLGVHYVGDVLVGGWIGGIYGWAGWRLWKWGRIKFVPPIPPENR